LVHDLVGEIRWWEDARAFGCWFTMGSRSCFLLLLISSAMRMRGGRRWCGCYLSVLVVKDMMSIFCVLICAFVRFSGLVSLIN
jgi:hypothetical protein